MKVWAATIAMDFDTVLAFDFSTGKKCLTCQICKLFEGFCRDKTRPDGYHSRCKQCFKEQKAGLWTDHVPRARMYAQWRQEKTCVICGKCFTPTSKSNARSTTCSPTCCNAKISKTRIDVLSRIVRTRKCAHCETEFCPTQGKRRCCSEACRLAQREMGLPVRRDSVKYHCSLYYSNCEICKALMIGRRKHAGRFCSVVCRKVNWSRLKVDGRALGQKRRTSPTNDCAICGNAFAVSPRETHYKCCSPKCTSELRATYKRTEGITLNCKQCKNDFPARYGQRFRLFCSMDCYTKWMPGNMPSGESSAMWRGGTHILRGESWLEARSAARKRDKYTCQDCGKTRSQLKRCPDVHHIVPFRLFGMDKHGEANDLSNLISLCMSCHHKAEGVESRHIAWKTRRTNGSFVGTRPGRTYKKKQPVAIATG